MGIQYKRRFRVWTKCAKLPDVGIQKLPDVGIHLCKRPRRGCNFCARRGKASVLRLMHEHGSNMPIPGSAAPAVNRLLATTGCTPRRAVRGASARVGRYLRERTDASLSAPLTLRQPSERSLIWLAVVSPTGNPFRFSRGLLGSPTGASRSRVRLFGAAPLQGGEVRHVADEKRDF
jgi:hypothetical protein